jgi:hypothetical protein
LADELRLFKIAEMLRHTNEWLIDEKKMSIFG